MKAARCFESASKEALVLKINSILVATDFSEASSAALRYGTRFARAYGATLHVLHVADDIGSRVLASAGPLPDVGQLQADLAAVAQRKLDELVTDEDRAGLRTRGVVVTSPSPARSILMYAKDNPVDLIIVGTHGRSGLAHFLLGSVAEHVVRMAPCPVLTVREHEHEFVLPDALQVTAEHRS
jgi:nucleotide-binding universal stress UspA family protein